VVAVSPQAPGRLELRRRLAGPAGGYTFAEIRAAGLSPPLAAMVVMLAVNATGTLRLPAEAELYGMDLHEHGISAYPEYVITALGSPTGLAAQQQSQTASSPIKATAPAHGD
jgi:hypothetical protein